jgi:hypothetical protein
MCAFIKAGLLIYLQTDILTTYFGNFKRTTCIIVVGLLTIIANLLISGKIMWFTIVDNSTIKFVLTFATVVLLPFIVLIFYRRERIRCEK